MSISLYNLRIKDHSLHPVWKHGNMNQTFCLFVFYTLWHSSLWRKSHVFLVVVAFSKLHNYYFWYLLQTIQTKTKLYFYRYPFQLSFTLSSLIVMYSLFDVPVILYFTRSRIFSSFLVLINTLICILRFSSLFRLINSWQQVI